MEKGEIISCVRLPIAFLLHDKKERVLRVISPLQAGFKSPPDPL
jgi:hypothetical protein